MVKAIFHKYLLFCGVAAHLAAIVGLVIYLQFAERHGFGEIVGKINSRFGNDHPTIMSTALGVLSAVGLPTRKTTQEIKLPPFPGPQDWPLHGVIPSGLAPQRYDDLGVPIQSRAIEGDGVDPAATTEVGDTKSFIAALKRANAGDTITLLPGTYVIHGRRISLAGDGLPSMPIVVRARQFGEVTIELDTLEGFFVDKSHWVFENLKIRGICKDDSRCEHAFHVFGTAYGVTIRNNEITEFNAAVKVNGLRSKGQEEFPDYGLVQNNTIYNTRPRDTGNPATPLNINSGNGWVVSANFVADFSKGRGDRISYAAFMKGNSTGGIFERNLIVCHWRLPVDGDTRLGISLGGGGTGARFCRHGRCENEHTGGTIRNNIIARCPADVGIYLNRAAFTQIYSNLLVDTAGIDVRFQTSSASIHNNILDGRILDRNGGSHTTDNNLIASECGLFASWFGDCDLADWYRAPLAGDYHLVDGGRIIDRGNSEPGTARDFCGAPRTGTPDIGPVEYGAAPLCLPGAAD